VDPEGTVGAHLRMPEGGRPLLRTPDGAVVAGAVETADGSRVVVVAVDLPEAPWSSELVRTATTWLRPAASAGSALPRRDVVETEAWARLKAAVARVQAVQVKDGSVPEEQDRADATAAIHDVVAAVEELAPHFPHDEAYLTALVAD